MRHFKKLKPHQQAHVRAWLKRAYEQVDPGERAFERADRIHNELDAINAYVERCLAGEHDAPPSVVLAGLSDRVGPS